MNRSQLLKWSALCFSIIVLSIITKGIALIVTCVLAICAVIYKKSAPQEKRFFATVFLIVFLLRVIAAISYQLYVDVYRNHEPFATDEVHYLALGWYYTLLLKFGTVSNLASGYYDIMNPLVKEAFFRTFAAEKGGGLPFFGWGTYSLILSCFYFLFGYSPLLARFLNIFIGLLGIIGVYFIAKSVFDKDVARLSFAIFAFLPSQFFFSISILRDIFVGFLVISILLAIYMIKTVKHLIALLVPLIASYVLLFYLHRFFCYLLLVIIGIGASIKLLNFKRQKILSLIFIVIILSVIFNDRVSTSLSNFLRKNYSDLLNTHTLKATEGGNTAYKLLLPAEIYTPEYSIERRKKAIEIYFSRKGINIDQVAKVGKVDLVDTNDTRQIDTISRDLLIVDISIRDLLFSYLKGLFYVLFKPFPWHVRKLTHVFASLQMVFWYMLFPFACIGLYKTSRNLTEEKLIFIIFFFSIISALALGEGNIGALFRHREIISFAYVIFSAVGLVSIFPKLKKM